MPSDKDINLLPEDLRIKKDKDERPRDFHIDLVVPDEDKKSQSSRSSNLFAQKLKNIFSKKTRFEIPQAPKKNKEETEEKNKKEEDFSFGRQANKQGQKTEFSQLHLPKKENRPEEKKIHYVKKTGFDFSLPAEKKEKSFQLKKESFWSRLKNIFKKKTKVKKEKKEEKETYEVKPLLKGSDSILIKGINGNGALKPVEPEVKPSISVAQEEVLPVKEELKTTHLEPELKPISMPEPVKSATTKSDFSIPEAYNNQSQKEVVKDKNSQATERFHQPQFKDANRFVDGGAGLDLIPKSVRTKSWRQIAILAMVALVGSSLIAGIFYAYLFFQESNILRQQERRSNQISDLEKQILEYESLNQEISALGEEIRTVHNLLNKHIYWTNFFAMLEKYTPEEVYYQGISAGNKGALTLSAVGSGYDSPARLLKLLQQPEAQEFVSMASISSASLREQGVSFNVTLVLNENLFYYGYGPQD